MRNLGWWGMHLSQVATTYCGLRSLDLQCIDSLHRRHVAGSGGSLLPKLRRALPAGLLTGVLGLEFRLIPRVIFHCPEPLHVVAT